MIDESTDFGARAAAHLRDDLVVWLTTVSPSGAPLPTPVWFLWDGTESLLVYSRDEAVRVRHIETNARVSLNFGGDGNGGDIVVFSGRAAVDGDAPPVVANAVYLEKYDAAIQRIGMDPASFADRYGVPVRIQLTKLRGH